MTTGVRAFIAGALVLTLCSAAAAQETRFRVFQRGMEVGFTTVTLEHSDQGWRLKGHGELKGTYQIVTRQLDILYDDNWRPRIMTMEMATPDDSAVVHIAFGLADGTTRTDVVRPNAATWGSNPVSPDTLPLPDLLFGAFEGLAGRLATASPGTEMHVFVAPRFEGLMTLDGASTDVVETTAGPLETKRWRMTLRRPEGPAPLEIWVAGGRMVRLDQPKDGISVVRQDVVWGK
jgi:hypothetical protein